MTTKTTTCPCGSGRPFEACCQPYLEGWERAPTAEALMRSRYTAYAKRAIDYLERTSGGEALATFSRRDVTAWANVATFVKLEVLATERGGVDDEEGLVDFAATYEEASKPRVLRERSLFRRAPEDPATPGERGPWRYVGRAKGEPVTRAEPRVGRNDPCPCGSGLKFKKCHGA